MSRNDLRRTHAAIPGMVDALRRRKIGRRDFLRTTTLLGLSATTAYGLVGRITGDHFMPKARAQEVRRGGVLRTSMKLRNSSDPALFAWSEEGNVARQVIEPLVMLGPDNIARPWLAERWEASEDLKTWTFHLRQGVKWNNGDDFIADDVIANFERWLDPATGSSNYGRFATLRGPNDGDPMLPDAVVRIDDHTVRFNLRVGDLALPENMTDYPALIVHRRFAEEGGNFVENPVGTGPFLLQDFAIGERAVYARRNAEDYWGSDIHVDGIEFIDHGEDPAAALAALASGQVDLLFRLFSIDQVPTVEGMSGFKLYETLTAQTGVARMRVTEPPFDDIRVRQAILASLDNQVLLDLGNGGFGLPGENHHVSPVHPAYAQLPPQPQDYDRARRLLGEAGYGDGLDLTIDCVPVPSWEPNTCQVIAEMVRPAGINLTVNIMPGSTYWDRWLSAPFGFTSWAHRPLGVTVLNLGYRSGAVWNETSYANPEFDRLLDQANALIDIDARREVMADLQRIMQADAIVAQPFWRTVYTASSGRVNGFEIQPALEHHYHGVWLS